MQSLAIDSRWRRKPHPRSRRCHRSRSLSKCDHCAHRWNRRFQRPTGDPDVDNTALARFVRDATIQSVRPIADEHTGRFGVAIEPIAEDKVGRVVFAGVVAARVNVQETWHQYADVADAGERHSSQSPTGRPKSYGDAMRIKRASSGLLFESENQPIQRSW